MLHPLHWRTALSSRARFAPGRCLLTVDFSGPILKKYDKEREPMSHFLYLSDVFCPWCYGFAPVMQRLAAEHPDLPVRVDRKSVV